MQRNNTNFQIQTYETLRALEFPKEYAFLKYFQNIVREFYINPVFNARGLLLYYGMGVGKTLTAIGIAMEFINTHNVVVLLSKSLQFNMRQTIHQYVQLRTKHEPEYLPQRTDISLDAWIDEKFSFVSMNASNTLDQMYRAVKSDSILVSAKKKRKPKRTDDNDELYSPTIELLKKDRIHSIENRVLIIDEAHNFFRSIINGSSNASELYEIIMNSKNIRVIFLTGTPVSKNPFELAPCFNMLAGETVLPEDYTVFTDTFVDSTGKIKNKCKFQNRITGLVSYAAHDTKFGANSLIKNYDTSVNGIEFPENLGIIRVNVEMSRPQYAIYRLARDAESDETEKESSGMSMLSTYQARAPLAKLNMPKSSMGSSYRVKSRQASNFVPSDKYRTIVDGVKPKLNDIPDDECKSVKFDSILQHQPDNEIGLVYSQFIGIGGLGSFAKYLQSQGYSPFNNFPTAMISELPEPKVADMIRTMNMKTVLDGTEPTHLPESMSILMPDVIDDDDLAPHDIVDLGIDDIKITEAVEMVSDPPVGGSRDNVRKTYAVITGDVPISDRTVIIKVFNSEENKRGALIQLLLISSTGAEGLDLKNVRKIHIMEPYWNYGRIEQIQFRGIRTNSHVALPKSERNVTTYVYVAMPPKDADADVRLLRGRIDTGSTDAELYERSIENMHLITSFNDALKEASIDCKLNEGVNCRMCTPTNKPLYTTRLDDDIAMPDPCRPLIETSVIADSITVDGQVYRYVKDEESLYGYSVFTFNKNINKYIKLTSIPNEVIQAIEDVNK